MKKKELLTEIMGVPKAVDFWVDYFTLILMGMTKGVTKSNELEEAPMNYKDPDTGEEIEDTAYRGHAKMTGQQFMKHVVQISGGNSKSLEDSRSFLNNPNFKNFPLFNPNIGLKVMFFPDKMWEKDIEPHDAVEAAHSWSMADIKLSKMGGDNVVFVGNDFDFTIYAPISWLDNINEEQFKKVIKPTLGHELTHAYETYIRLKHGKGPHQGRESMLNLATQKLRDDKYPQWKEFLGLVYLHLSFEINARITQLYYTMKNKNVSTQEEFMDVLKKSSVWHEIKLLENFDTEKFINSFTVADKEHDFMKMMMDMGNQFERQAQGLPAIKRMDTPQEGMLHLIDSWNKALQTFNKRLERGGYEGKFMELVPERALKDPLFFFKFFEERFHKKAENFKRKALRLASLVLDEKKQENEKSN